MSFREYVAILFFLSWVAAYEAAKRRKPIINKDYLGSQPSKAYFFPWMVSIHREYSSNSEIFGSGSIVTPMFILGSMDSLIRNSTTPPIRPFFHDMNSLVAYSGSIWGTPYYKGRTAPEWLEKRRIAKVWMWSAPDPGFVKRATKEYFFGHHRPPGMNSFKRSPFGFSMSIALMKIQRDAEAQSDSWTWRRNTLPLPLFSWIRSEIRTRMIKEIERFEEDPFNVQCVVGGWQIREYRLIEHKVVYVPMDQCQVAYCSFDPRACYNWPVRDVHGCFQSMAFSGPCWQDQGSALYCRQVSESAIAILTSAPTCGAFGLPGVFTWIHHGMVLLDGLGDYRGIPKNEEAKYTPPPEKDLLPAYR